MGSGAQIESEERRRIGIKDKWKSDDCPMTKEAEMQNPNTDEKDYFVIWISPARRGLGEVGAR